MRDPIILLVHLIATLARLMGPGGLRSVVAASVLVKQPLLILNRSRHRAPNLCASDRILAGVCALFMRPARVIRSAIVLRPSTILEFHRALRTRKYRWLFSPTRRRTGPQGPSKALVDAIVDMKRRNPRWGCPRIAQQIALAFAVDMALLRGSKTDPQRPLPTDPLTTDRVRRRPTKLSHLIEDVTCEDGLRLLPRPTARSKALPDDQLVPEEGVLHTGLLMVARVLLPLSPSSLLHLSDRAVARGRSWSPSRHGGCPGRWNDDRRATRTRSLVDATRVVGRVRREAGDVAFDLVDQIEGRRRVVNMPAGQGVSDDHARSVDAQMKLLPAAYTASTMFHGRPFTFTHSREPGTVDDEMYACARGEAAKCKVEVLTTP